MRVNSLETTILKRTYFPSCKVPWNSLLILSPSAQNPKSFALCVSTKQRLFGRNCKLEKVILSSLLFTKSVLVEGIAKKWPCLSSVLLFAQVVMQQRLISCLLGGCCWVRPIHYWGPRSLRVWNASSLETNDIDSSNWTAITGTKAVHLA